MDLGFIGLGGMGQGMARRLLAAGHRVRVWNRSPAPLQAIRGHGAEIAAEPSEVVGGDAFISMLADDATVRDVVIGRQILGYAGASTVHVNMATISLTCAQELAATHRTAGVAYVAAPVFGRPEMAAAGKLHILAAGEAAAINRVQPLFDAMGERTWRLGDDPGKANVVKIAGNFMVVSAIEAIAEAAALVEGHDIDAAKLFEVLTAGLFTGPVYRGYGELIGRRCYEPAGFRLRHGLKDVRIALAAGESANVPLPLASILRDNFIDAIAHGDGDKDWSAVADVARRRAGLSRVHDVEAAGRVTSMQRSKTGESHVRKAQ